jgi:hypothetical protein
MLISKEDLQALRTDAQEKLREAERAWFTYALNTDLGEEREIAFEIFENVRTAARIH